jgi:hypothetical protein
MARVTAASPRTKAFEVASMSLDSAILRPSGVFPAGARGTLSSLRAQNALHPTPDRLTRIDRSERSAVEFRAKLDFGGLDPSVVEVNCGHLASMLLPHLFRRARCANEEGSLLLRHNTAMNHFKQPYSVE